MGHDHMDHSGHMDHGHGDGGSMEPMCSMNMLFTWDTENLCIVFRQWRVTSTPSLLFSLIVVILLGVGYEGLRSICRTYELSLDKNVEALPHHDRDANAAAGNITETTPFLSSGQSQADAGKRAHLIKSVLYGLQHFYGFMLMLVFMTYNGWVMISLSFGAALGYLVFGKRISATKENPCH